MTKGSGRARAATLRSRLTLLATALVALVLLASAFALVTVQRQLLTRGVDDALLQRADNVQAAVAQQPAGTVLPGEGDREDSFLQLLDPNGRVVASSSNIAALPAVAKALASRDAPKAQTVRVTSLSASEYRLYSRPVASVTGPRTLLLGKNVDDVNDSVTILETSLAVAIPIVVALLAAGVWWLTGRVLRPVEAIRSEVASISGAELHRRVPVQPRADEISRLANTMNAMLERVQHATDRQRQFVADASHELRSPLTRIRSELEIALAHPDASPPQQTFRELLTDTQELQQLVDDLLFLARSESGVHPRPDTIIDLDDLLLEQMSRLKSRGHINTDVHGVSAGRVTGDPHQLARAIANVVRNAERYAATTVTVALREDDSHTVLTVTDDGPGIPEDQREAVFERFTRLDSSRTREAGGAGLGLAIVHDIVTRHRGTIVITAAHPTGARITMSFPHAD
jgi:signal transduction histidine kinase